MDMIGLLFSRSDKYYELQHSSCLKYLATLLAIGSALFYLYDKDVRYLLVIALCTLPILNSFFIVLTLATSLSMVTIRLQLETLQSKLDSDFGESPIRIQKQCIPQEWSIRNIILSFTMLSLPMFISIVSLYMAHKLGIHGYARTMFGISIIVTSSLFIYGIISAMCCYNNRCNLISSKMPSPIDIEVELPSIGG
jgi:hypothetical protein